MGERFGQRDGGAVWKRACGWKDSFRFLLLASAVVGVTLCFLSTPSGAENYLLPTAIVPPGRVEAEAEYRYERIRSNVAGPVASLDGLFKTSSSTLDLSVSVGIYPDLQVSIGVPVVFLEREHREITGLTTTTAWDRDGIGDPTFLASYKILDEAERGLTLTADAGIKPDTASDRAPDAVTGRRGGIGSGTTDYIFGLSSSKAFSKWVPYATLGAVVAGETGQGLSHGGEWNGSIGTEYRWTDSLTLDTRVFARRFGRDETANIGSRETYRAGMRAYYAIWKNGFVIPSLSFVRTSDYDSDFSIGLRNENNRGYEAGIGLYAVY